MLYVLISTTQVDFLSISYYFSPDLKKHLLYCHMRKNSEKQ
jgi:hypothetical protein